MATRKQIAPKTVVLTGQEQEYHAPTLVTDDPQDDDYVETAVDRVSTMLEGLDPEAKSEVKVFRVNSDGTMGYCKGYKPQEFEQGGFDMLRENFGAGKFEIRLHGIHPVSGSYRMLQRQVIVIESLVSTAPALKVVNGENPHMMELLKQLVDRQAPVTSQKESMKEMLELMVLFKSVMGGDQPKNQLSDLVAAMREMREVSKEFSPVEKDTPDTLLGALTPILKIVADSQAQRTNTPLLPSAVVPQNLSAEVNPIADLTPEQKQQYDVFQAQMNMLIVMASAKQDTQTCADSFYPMLADELLDLLEEEKWFENLVQVEPRCADHQAWITEVRNHICKMIADDHEPEIEPVKKQVPAMTVKKKTVVKTQ